MLEITPSLHLPETALRVETSRSSGPGGQNVNKVETRVSVILDLDAAEVLSPEQRELIHRRLASRISRSGELRVSSQRHRTQGANREAARLRLAELIGEALTERRPRRPTRISKAAQRRRIEAKRRRSALKRLRSRGSRED